MSYQSIRDQISKGDEVVVLVRFGHGQVKRRSAKVLDVMRGAVKVKIDERTTTIPFGEIELAPRSTPLPPPRGAKDVIREPEPIVPKPPIMTTPLVTAAPVLATIAPTKPATRGSDDVAKSLSTWLEMGDELANELSVVVAERLQERRGLDEERAAIEVRHVEIEEEIRDLNARIELIRKIGRPR